jgi:hypothetical protein
MAWHLPQPFSLPATAMVFVFGRFQAFAGSVRLRVNYSLATPLD